MSDFTTIIIISDACDNSGVTTYFSAYADKTAYSRSCMGMGKALATDTVASCRNEDVAAALAQFRKGYCVAEIRDTRRPHPACRNFSWEHDDA